MADTPLTPMMQQFRAAKAQNPGMVVLFRNGDFYELFEDDAELGARVLGLTLTRRDKEIPMSGFPQHKLEHYLGVLLRAGHRVAVCEQLEEAGPGKKLIRREVNRIVTPGTVTEDELLDPRRPNHLVALTRSKQGVYGLAWADLSTGSFSAADLAENQLPDELARLAAVECLLPDDLAELLKPTLGANPPRAITPRPAWTFDPTTALAALKRQFQVATLTGFGFGDEQPCVAAAGALLLYLEETLKASLAHLRRLRPHRPETFLVLDEVTRRSLELTRTMRDNLRDGSLLSVIDRTVTPMGARLLHDSLLAPLNSRPAIEARLDAVEELLRDHPLRGSLRDLLDATSDLQRLTTRVSTARATPKDLAAVGRTLQLLPKFKTKLAGRKSALLGELETKLELCPDIRDLLERAITDDPPYSAKEGGIIRESYHAELDELRKLARDGKDWIARYQAQEVMRTNINSLKIGFTDVMGYYIEVTNANENRVPQDYIHERTLKGAKRYSTPRLKEYEEKVVTAQERSQALEFELFAQLREQVAAQTHRLLQTADVLALLDLLAALAELAASRNYIRPRIADEPIFAVQEGRHPVLEQTLPPGTFVPNDALFSPVDGVFWLITGPNMSGKCVREDTLIFTDRGLLTIEELKPEVAPIDEFVPLECQVQGRSGRSAATHFYNGGVTDTIRVEMRYGFHLEGTPEHRVWVRCANGSEGWVSLRELSIGDRVAVERGIDLWGRKTRLRQPTGEFHGNTIRYQLPKRLTPDLAYLLGLLTGDGTLTYPNHVALSSGDEFLAREFTRISQELFGCPVQSKRNGKDYVLSSRLVREFLAINDLGYHRAAEKRVPRCVRVAPRACVVGFLQGLFDTDGTAENRYGNVRFNTASPRMVREVQILLLNLGIVATLGIKPTASLPSYQLNIDGEDAIRFYQLVGFRLLRKHERAKLCSPIRRPNKGGIPHLASTLKIIQERIATTPAKPVALKRVKSINSIFYTYLPNGRNPSYAKLGELADYCQVNRIACPELDSILTAEYFYDEVVQTIPSRGQVYDLSVPDGHAFVANGLINHNSTFIRQVALLTLLAHVGSFIPAKAATIGTTDRIFTRVGASDELSRGQSTFMVEMTEAANILNNATSRSLVILDEIGRGTSTYDGLSLAWAITEHLHDAAGCRALFATHYHELAQLASSLPRLRNYTVQVQELEKEIVFLHKIAAGSADRSYGIHVARMAGVPESVLHRAEQVLATLECRQELKAPVAEPSAPPPKPKRNGQPEPRIVSPPEADKPRRKKEPAGPSLFGEGEAV